MWDDEKSRVEKNRSAMESLPNLTLLGVEKTLENALLVGKAKSSTSLLSLFPPRIDPDIPRIKENDAVGSCPHVLNVPLDPQARLLVFP